MQSNTGNRSKPVLSRLVRVLPKQFPGITNRISLEHIAS
jgi:hypothetical protein